MSALLLKKLDPCTRWEQVEMAAKSCFSLDGESSTLRGRGTPKSCILRTEGEDVEGIRTDATSKWIKVS